MIEHQTDDGFLNGIAFFLRKGFKELQYTLQTIDIFLSSFKTGNIFSHDSFPSY